MTSSRAFGFRCRCGKLIIFEVIEYPEDIIDCKCGLNSSEKMKHILKELKRLTELATEGDYNEYEKRWQFIEFIFELLDPHKLWEEDKK